jgi:hypothetical protein
MNLATRIAGGLALLLLGAACEPVPEPPPSPGDVRPAFVAGPLDVTIETITDATVRFAAGLSDLGLVLHDSEGTRLIEADGTSAEVSGDLGEWYGAVEWEGDLLISSDQGLHAILAGEWVPSPLQTLLGPATRLTPLRVEPGGPAQLWLAGDESLLLWRDGELSSVALAELPTAGVALAWGGSVGGLEALWAASEQGVVALRVQGSQVSGILQKNDLTRFDGLAVDTFGSVWVGEGDLLWRRDVAGEWTAFRTPFEVRALGCAPGSNDLWLETDEGLFHQEGSTFSPVGDGDAGRLLGVDPSGRALFSTDAGLLRVAVGRPTLFTGIADWEELEGPTDVRMHPSAPDLLASLTVSLDGETVGADVEGLWDPEVDLTLDPLALENGPHQLSAVATYSDREDAFESSLTFVVGPFVPPTWSEDLHPVFVEHCRRCHDSGGALAAGVDLPLDSAEDWQANIEAILRLVQDGTMPSEEDEALSDEEVQTIRAWRAGGFLGE